MHASDTCNRFAVLAEVFAVAAMGLCSEKLTLRCYILAGFWAPRANPQSILEAKIALRLAYVGPGKGAFRGQKVTEVSGYLDFQAVRREVDLML